MHVRFPYDNRPSVFPLLYTPGSFIVLVGKVHNTAERPLVAFQVNLILDRYRYTIKGAKELSFLISPRRSLSSLSDEVCFALEESDGMFALWFLAD